MEPEEQENEEILCMDGENDEEIEFVNEGLKISKKKWKKPNFSLFKFLKKKGGNNKEDDEFDNIVGTLQEIVLDEQFEKLQTNFFRENCEVFDEEEENKMIYLEIFKKYQTIIEDSINMVFIF